jgi:hypothetical protein
LFCRGPSGLGCDGDDGDAVLGDAVPMKSIDIEYKSVEQAYQSVELVYMDVRDLRRSEWKEPTQDIGTARSEVRASLATLTRPVNGREARNKRDLATEGGRGEVSTQRD